MSVMQTRVLILISTQGTLLLLLPFMKRIFLLLLMLDQPCIW